MKITIGIVNYNRSRMLSPCQERSISNYLFLLPNCIASLTASVDKQISAKDIDLIIVDFNSTDWPPQEWMSLFWPYNYKIIKAALPFSIGKGRNIIVNDFSGDILILLDADMLVPADFMAGVVEALVSGFVIMPLYLRYSNPEQTKTSEGVGYGNLVINSDVVAFLRQKFAGKPYPETERWGGEDVAVARAIQCSGKWPVKRELLAGFYHQWHPKTGDFYKKI
jgi:glycosyltransferase involved in cell wall biosynthesis